MAEAMIGKAKLRAVRGLRDQFEDALVGSDEWQREAKKFLKRQPTWAKKDPKARIFTLKTDLFDPVAFCGVGWSVLEEDKHSCELVEVDMTRVRFLHMLREEEGETSTKGEEKILRLKTMSSFAIRLDARFARDLLAEPGQVMLDWLYQTQGVTWIDFPGTILRGPSGSRFVLCLYRDERGWDWDADWLENVWSRGSPSAVLVL